MSTEIFYATGRRKTSSARVYLKKGKGDISVNDRKLDEYFGRKVAQMLVMQPLELLDLSVTTVYSILPDEISKDLENSLDSGEIWKCNFNFRADYRMETCFILKNDTGYFAIVGIPNHINMLSPNALPPEDEDADEDDELDFEMF